MAAGQGAHLSVIAWTAFAIVGLPICYVIFAFNRFVAYRNEIRNSRAQIDVQLGRRHDLIPRLVDAVRGYMKFEKDLLQSIAEARARAVRASGMAARARAEGRLTRLLDGLFAVWEKYPELKASRSCLDLQRELTSTENKIAYTRGHYNDIVANYNALVQAMPSGLVARMLGFREQEFFQAPVGDRRRAEAKP